MTKKTKKIAPKKSERRKIPGWLTDHFEQSIDSHETLIRIIGISERGINMLTSMPRLVSAVAKYHGEEDDPKRGKELEALRDQAALAAREVANDFPVLHGFAVVALWSWLENFVKGLVVLWLTHRRDAYAVPELQKLRVRLGEYLPLPKSEQAYYVVELLEQELASSLKRGVTRFESLLEPFSLSGIVEDDCKKALFELQQLRNAIAHKNGFVDRHLKLSCPWLKLRLGRPVQVSHRMLERYAVSSADYLVAVLYRVGDLYGIDLREVERSKD